MKLASGFVLVLLLLVLLGVLSALSLREGNTYSDRQADQQNIVIEAQTLKGHVNNMLYQSMRGMYAKDVRAADKAHPAPGSYRYFLDTMCVEVDKAGRASIATIQAALTDKEDVDRCERAAASFKKYEEMTTQWADLQDAIHASADKRLELADDMKKNVDAIKNRVKALVERDHPPILDKETGRQKVGSNNLPAFYAEERLVYRQQTIGQILEQIEKLRRLTREQIAITDRKAMEDKNAQITAMYPEFEKELGDLMKTFTTTTSRAEGQKVLDLFAEWQADIEHYGDLILRQENLFADMGRTAQSILEDTNAVIATATQLAHRAGEQFDSNNAFAIRLIVVIGAAAVLLGVVLAWWLSVNIAVATTKITGLLGLVVDEGDITVQVDPALAGRGDEVGQLARTVENIVGDYVGVSGLARNLAEGDWTVSPKIKSNKDDMNLNLRAMIEQVNGSLLSVASAVGQVTTGSREIASTSQTLASGATQSAASIEEITASMGEMGAQVNANAQNAGEARQLARKASDAGADGQEMMNRMIAAMQDITKNSQEVKNVIKVIDDISFQTNLLALNAAVEAARAGTHGKGFAVVAEEVRNLAARCAKAAGETTRMIEGNNRQINAGAEIASETADKLNQIVEHSAQTAALIERIATASNEQAQGITQVTQGLQQIDSVTQQNTASAEETASVSSEMSSQAANLQTMIDFFRLKQSDAYPEG